VKNVGGILRLCVGERDWGGPCCALAGLSSNGLILGDTVGRTPGAYGFIVSCDLTGYVGPTETISAASLVVTRSKNQGINPLGNAWTSNAGPGPAKVLFSMVRVLPPASGMTASLRGV
jgi:hypothetical protein